MSANPSPIKSSKLILGLLATSVFSFIVFYFSMAHFWPPSHSTKEVTTGSVDDPKHWPVGFAAKHLALFSMALKQNGETPTDQDQSLELIAYITATQDLPQGFSVQWILPDQVIPVESGFVNQEWGEIKAGQTVTAKLTVTGFSKLQNSIVSVQAITNNKGQQLSASALISSRPEDSLEYIAPDLQAEESAFRKKRRPAKAE